MFKLNLWRMYRALGDYLQRCTLLDGAISAAA